MHVVCVHQFDDVEYFAVTNFDSVFTNAPPTPMASPFNYLIQLMESYNDWVELYSKIENNKNDCRVRNEAPSDTSITLKVDTDWHPFLVPISVPRCLQVNWFKAPDLLV